MSYLIKVNIVNAVFVALTLLPIVANDLVNSGAVLGIRDLIRLK